ncbi:MAG TPA: hydroxymethylbilane synthase [Phenylobacterium sp.]|nr:hydroxymethylbilane synthase [Phenylobacterium sp.]
MSTQPLVRIGARGSKLSLAQAGQMQRRIAAALGAPEAEAERVAPITVITTTGDRIQDRRLLEIGGKALFTKEIEEALIAGRIDCAIHSMKDVPAEQPPGLCIAAVPEREDVRDAFISLKWERLEDLPQGAVLGTASLRRQAQSLHRRPDLRVELLRGNVDTRLAKLERGEAEAILLAKAGLNRLGLADRPKSLIDPREAPPAPGQGALAIQTREGDRTAAWITPLHHRQSELTVAAERGALVALEGSCRTPVGAHAIVEGETLTLLVEALSPDGRQRFRREGEASLAGDAVAAARALGLRLGREVADEGGEAILLPAP